MEDETERQLREMREAVQAIARARRERAAQLAYERTIIARLDAKIVRWQRRAPRWRVPFVRIVGGAIVGAGAVALLMLLAGALLWLDHAMRQL